MTAIVSFTNAMCQVFIWVGQSASDIEKKLSLKSAQVRVLTLRSLFTMLLLY